MKPKTPKLKPCPFCGKVPGLAEGYNCYYVMCDNKKCAVQPVSNGHPRSEEVAVKYWNSRKGEKCTQ